jgi:hypothetical protein
MEIKTWEDVKKASIETGISAGKIARIYEIKITSRKNDFQYALEEAVTERNVELMWRLFERSVQGSEEKVTALKEIFKVATSEEDVDLR